VIFKPLPDDAAGCIAYLIGCEREGVAVLVDPGRPGVEEYVALAAARGLAL